jgi:hypothetical protein
MRKTVSVFVVLFIFCSCKHNYTPPADFNFSLSFGYFDDQISTFDSTFITDGNRPGSKRIKVIFTKAEMQQIYKRMIDYNYLDLPDNMGPKEHPVPWPEYYLVINTNSTKKAIHSCPNFCTNDKKIEKFDSIMNEILKILHSKKEIKDLSLNKRIAL